MSSKGNVKVSILGDASDLNRATSEASAHIEEFSKKTKESFAKVKEAGKLLAEIGGLSALTFGLKDVTEEAVKAEAEQKKLANTVKDAGLSWKAHSGEIDEWLDKTSRASGFAKSDLSASLGNLIRTTGNVKDAQKLSNEAMDVARSKGVGLANAQSLLARVYNGSYTGLKRLGLQVKPVTTAQDELAKSSGKATDAQKAHAKALDTAATRTKALQLVQQKFGGQSAAYAKSTAGSFERAKQSLNLVEEQVGQLVLPVMAKAADAIGRVATKAAQEWPKIAPIVKKAFGTVRTDVEAVVKAVKDLVAGFQDGKTSAAAIVGTLGGLAAAFAALKIINTVNGLLKGTKEAMVALRLVTLAENEAMRANPIGLVVTALALLGGALVTAYKTNEQFRAKVQAAWAWIKANAGPIFDGVKKTIGVAFDAIKTAVSTAVKFVMDWINKNRANIAQFGQAWLNIGKAVETVVKTYITGLLIPELKLVWKVMQAGFDVVKTVWPGIKQVLQGALKVISGVIAVFTGVFTGDWQKAWDGLKEIAGGVLKALVGVINTATAPIQKAFTAIWHGLGDIVGSAFGTVKTIVAGALNGVIDLVNVAITGIDKMIGLANKLPGVNVPTIPKLGHIDLTSGGSSGSSVGAAPHGGAFAAGGVVLPGSDKQDSTWVRASGGETVFTYSGQSIINMVGAAAGVPNLVGMALANQAPHFAGGGIIGNAYTQGYDVGAQAGSLNSLINDIIGRSLLAAPKKKTSTSSRSGSTGSAPGGVREWLTQALKITGHFSEANLAALTRRTMQESTGNPRAINNWDSNAKAGHPSKGLLQTIDGTFNTYKLPGHGNIWNPIDNAIAAIRYMYAQYGHIVDASGKGYRVGGMIGRRAFRAGGRIPKIIRSLEHASRTSVKGLLRQLAQAAASEGMSQNELFAAQAAVQRAMKQSGNTKAGAKGLKGALSLVQGEQGRRIGVDVGAVDALTSQLSDQADTLDLTQQAQGLDSDSEKAISQRLSLQNRGLAALQVKKAQLQSTLKTAKKTHNKKLVRNVSAAIKGVNKDILSQRASIVGTQAEGPTQDDYLNAAASQAALTPGLGDDRAAAAAIQQSAAAKLAAAQKGGDPRKIDEAAQALKTASDNLASIDEQLKQQAYDSNDAKQSLDKLAEVQGDPEAKKRELADLGERKTLDEQNLAEAKASNDPAKIAAAADRETQTIQAMNDLKDSLNQVGTLAQQQAELNQQVVDNQTKLLALAGQGDQILGAVIAAVNGGIGGRIGLGTQSPSFAGGVARY